MRLLKAEEIEVRIAAVRSTGISLILYKDARCDQNLLDETFGSMGWQRSHQVIDGNLYCTVSVWDEEKGQWISKQDVGKESYTEKEKGRASDSFKRACFNFGIGRELYTAPFIWIPSSLCKIDKEGDSYKCKEQFEVSEIGYDKKRNINKLIIINSNSKTEVFSWQKTPTQTFKVELIDATKVKALEKMCKDEEIPILYLCDLYGVNELKELNEAKFNNIAMNWEKVKAKYNERNNT